VHTLDRMGFRAVDVAEYAPGIVHASAQWFGNVNGNVLAQPQVRLHLEDGRNFVLLSPAHSFDLVSIEISSVWFAGATNLYSREFYELVKSRLRTGGAFQQWIQFHHTRPRELAVQIATLRAVFPYVSLWSAGGQGIMVATDQPQELTEARRTYLIEHLRTIERIPQSKQQELQAQLFDTRLLSAAAVDRLLAQVSVPVNTDHNRWIEYATPRYNWTGEDGTANLAWLKTFAEPAQETVSTR
jgi:spermidine synthase